MINTSSAGSARAEGWALALERLEVDRLQVRAGGGPDATARQHAKGRLTARERVTALIDPGTPFDELMAFAGYQMYREAGGCPAGGVVTGGAGESADDTARSDGGG